MIEINQSSLTALLGYSGAFYTLMEAILKPVIKTSVQRLRQKFAKEPLGEQGKEEQDERYAALLHSSFRVISVALGILFVWGSGVNISFFDIFGMPSETFLEELCNLITTGAAIGLGSRGTHFLVDMAESVLRFSLVRLNPNEPGVTL